MAYLLRNTTLLKSKPYFVCKPSFLPASSFNHGSLNIMNINLIKITQQKRTALNRIPYKDDQHYEDYPEGYTYKGSIPPLIEYMADDKQRVAPYTWPDVPDHVVRNYFIGWMVVMLGTLGLFYLIMPNWEEVDPYGSHRLAYPPQELEVKKEILGENWNKKVYF